MDSAALYKLAGGPNSGLPWVSAYLTYLSDNKRADEKLTGLFHDFVWNQKEISNTSQLFMRFISRFSATDPKRIFSFLHPELYLLPWDHPYHIITQEYPKKLTSSVHPSRHVRFVADAEFSLKSIPGFALWRSLFHYLIVCVAEDIGRGYNNDFFLGTNKDLFEIDFSLLMIGGDGPSNSMALPFYYYCGLFLYTLSETTSNPMFISAYYSSLGFMAVNYDPISKEYDFEHITVINPNQQTEKLSCRRYMKPNGTFRADIFLQLLHTLDLDIIALTIKDLQDKALPEMGFPSASYPQYLEQVKFYKKTRILEHWKADGITHPCHAPFWIEILQDIINKMNGDDDSNEYWNGNGGSDQQDDIESEKEPKTDAEIESRRKAYADLYNLMTRTMASAKICAAIIHAGIILEVKPFELSHFFTEFSSKKTDRFNFGDNFEKSTVAWIGNKLAHTAKNELSQQWITFKKGYDARERNSQLADQQQQQKKNTI